MNGTYSPEVATAIDLIWKSFNKEKMQQGYAMLEKAADKGDADAFCYLGRCHMGEEYVWCGGDFDVDEDRASQLIKESVRRGSASGVLCALRNGNLTPGVMRDMPFSSVKEAFSEILDQAKGGDAFCLYMIGNAMFWGDYLIIEKGEADKYNDEEEYNEFAYPIAAEYYEKSFDAGLSCAFGNYRTIYDSGLADIDEDTYEEYFQQLADNGDPLVCSDFGKYLEDEYENREKEALIYYKRAYDLGDRRSAYNLATCYGRGYGTPQNLDKAFEYYNIAAEAGEPGAMFELGNFYFEGRGNVTRDYAKAVYWLGKSYDSYDEERRWRPAAELAILHQDGLGTIQDDDMAYRRLSEIEDIVDEIWEPLDAQVLNALGVAYAFGRGTDTDIPRGIEYFDRAIEYGSDEAARNKAMFKKSIFGRWSRR